MFELCDLTTVCSSRCYGGLLNWYGVEMVEMLFAAGEMQELHFGVTDGDVGGVSFWNTLRQENQKVSSRDI